MFKTVFFKTKSTFSISGFTAGSFRIDQVKQFKFFCIGAAGANTDNAINFIFGKQFKGINANARTTHSAGANSQCLSLYIPVKKNTFRVLLTCFIFCKKLSAIYFALNGSPAIKTIFAISPVLCTDMYTHRK